MKFFMMSADARGTYDPPCWDSIRQMEGRTDDKKIADVICLVQTRHPEFRFNERLADEIGNKPWVLFDYVENGWDWDQEETMLFGKNTEKFFMGGYNEHWRKFDEFVRDKPPIMTFKRELLNKDRSDRLLPIEYTSYLPEPGLDSKEDFFKRPIEALFNWGRSSESRMYLHAAIFASAPAFGFDVISEWSHIEKAIKENISGPWKFVSVHAPHFARIDVLEVQKFCRMSRVGFVLHGAGVKTFRDAECAQDFVMARPFNNLAWAYPWNSENSIVLSRINSVHNGIEAVKIVMDALMDRDGLYTRYCAAMSNAANYRYDAYLRRHVSANIQRVL